jgi:hypothetical protein
MVTRKNTGVKMVTVTLKLPPDWVALIDNWVRDQPDVLMNRSDAIRLIAPCHQGATRKGD